jgi:hypothetical protein
MLTDHAALVQRLGCLHTVHRYQHQMLAALLMTVCIVARHWPLTASGFASDMQMPKALDPPALPLTLRRPCPARFASSVTPCAAGIILLMASCHAMVTMGCVMPGITPCCGPPRTVCAPAVTAIF